MFRLIFLLVLIYLSSTPSATAQIPSDLQLTNLGISPSTALAIRHAGDGSDRLFIVERSGRIRIFVPPSTLLGTAFLDIRTEVDTTFEGGMQGLAFHPDYSTNGFFYVYYTRDGGSDPLETVVERFTVSAGDTNIADKESREVIFTIGQPAANHNGGDIHFGPDEYLYIGLGDGGSSSATSQNINNLLGKMLRIDPCDTTECANGYAIPDNNPYVDKAGLDEIWASGLRNPYRWSFDRDTGEMFIADVGQGSREEVSFQATASIGSENYGWNCREGDISGPGNCSGSFVEPIITYSSSGGSDCSITGGYRYRGCIAGLQGRYIFGDYCSSKIRIATQINPTTWTVSEWADLSGNIFGFGEDENGELYVSQGGSISRFESPTSCEAASMFENGFEDP